MRTTTITVVVTTEDNQPGKLQPFITFTGNPTAQDISEDCQNVSQYLTMATFDEDGIQRHMNMGAIQQTQTVYNPKTDVTIQDAAKEMLIAFSEGVVWNDEQRTAYETLSSMLGIKASETV